MSLPRASTSSAELADRSPAADPWQGWGGILGLCLAILLFQVGCNALSPPTLSGLGKNLVGRWERISGSPETLIFAADGSFVQLRGRSEKLAREVDGWTFSTPGGSRWNVMVSDRAGQIGGFSVEFRDDDEIEILDGTGLKSDANLKGTYRRTSRGAASDGPPPKPGSIAEKLSGLESHLAKSEKRRDDLKKARVSLEKQRLEKLTEVRRAGVTRELPAEKYSASQKVLVAELKDIEQQDLLFKAKIDEIDATISKFRQVIRNLNTKLVIDGNEPTAGDLSELQQAEIELKLAQEDLNRNAPPAPDPLLEKILKGHLDDQKEKAIDAPQE